MSYYFDQAILIVKVSFTEDIEEKYHFNVPQPVENSSDYPQWQKKYEENRIAFVDFCTSTLNDVFEKFNASVLSGEYVESSEFDLKIQEFITALEAIPIPSVSPEFQGIITAELKEKFVDCLRVAAELYLDLFQQIKIRQSTEAKEYVTMPDYEQKKIGSPRFSNPNLVFFNNNVIIAILEHFLTPNLEVFSILHKIKHSFIQDGAHVAANKFSTLLFQKCSFLIMKWVLRRETLLESGNTLTIISGSKIINLGSVIEPKGNPFVVEWKDYIESHYDLDKRTGPEKIRARCADIRKRSLESLSLKELHSLIKYYKDIEANLSSLSEVRAEVEGRWKNIRKTSARNNIYALSISYHYALNNEFSLLLEKHPNKEKAIQRKYDEIIFLQTQTGIKNFFPQYKYSKYLVDRFKSILDNKKALDAVKHSRELILRCEEVLTTYEKNIKWSISNYNYVFLLPFEESFVPVNHPVLTKVYLSSSFLLPLSKEKYREEFDGIKRDFYSYTGSISVFENLERDIKDGQNRELRSMEIIAIFTAIVTFIAASIPSFKFIESPYQAAIFMLGLSCSLGLFILMIIIASRGIHKLREHWMIISCVLVLGIGAWVFLIYGTEDPNNDRFVKRPEFNKKLDSITTGIEQLKPALISNNSSDTLKRIHTKENIIPNSDSLAAAKP